MKVQVSLKYSEGLDESVFERKDIQIDEDTYIKQMTNEYYMYADSIYNAVSTGNFHTNAAKFGMRNYNDYTLNDDDLRDTYCYAMLYKENTHEETVDGLINHYARGDAFIENISLDIEGMNPEFAEEFSMWFREHQNINALKTRDVEWKFKNQPLRTINFFFKNNYNMDVCANFVKCRLLQQVNEDTYTILVEKLEILKK
jgi:hypothetical protein